LTQLLPAGLRRLDELIQIRRAINCCAIQSWPSLIQIKAVTAIRPHVIGL
jgi:hypothetical protein